MFGIIKEKSLLNFIDGITGDFSKGYFGAVISETINYSYLKSKWEVK